MKTHTPEALVDAFFDAFARRDLESLLALYEPSGSFAAQPGFVAEGRSAVREALAGFLAMKPVMTRHASRVVSAGDLALGLTRWTLEGTDANGAAVRMNGEATDVFRRGADGNWRVVIDNPWGIALLASEPSS